MTVVWWYLRLYCPSLVAWKYIGRFLGKSFLYFGFWFLGANKIKNYHTYIPFTTIRGFLWLDSSEITSPPKRKQISILIFLRYEELFLPDGQTYPAAQAQSFFDDSSVFAHHHHHHHKLPSRPFFFTRPPSTTYIGIIWPTPKTSAQSCLYTFQSALCERNIENWRNPILHVLRVFYKILHYFKPGQNRSLPQTLFWTLLFTIIKDLPSPVVLLETIYESYMPNPACHFLRLYLYETTTPN